MVHSPRETTAEMVGNISRKLAEIERAIVHFRGDQTAEARLTGTWMAHLLLCSPELLHNLLIDTGNRPQRLNDPE